MTTDPHRELVERYLAAYNAFDIPGLLALLDPAITFENVSDGTVTARASGLEEFRQLAERSATLFRSREQSITGYAPEANGATVAVAFTGVLAVDLSPELRAGDTLSLTGRSIFRMHEGRIARLVDES